MKSKYDDLLKADKLSRMTQQVADKTVRYGGINRLITSLLLVGLVVYFFLIRFRDSFPLYAGIILLVIALLRLLVNVVSLVKMRSEAFVAPDPPDVSSADAFAMTTQRVGLGRARYKIYRSIDFALLLIGLGVLVFFIGLPWYLAAALFVLAAVLPILAIIEMKRIASIDLTSPVGGDWEPLEAERDEIFLDSIPGALRVGLSAKSSTSVMGKGKVGSPENALLFTNKAIYALTVPLMGGDQMVAGADIRIWQWRTAYPDIRDGLRDMITSLPLEEVFKKGRAERLMGWGEIKNITAPPQRLDLSLYRADGKKFRYAIRQMEDYNRVRGILRIPWSTIIEGQ